MSFVTTLLNVLLVIVSVFLIGLVLIQRGRGGGLAGAFGGAGGSSAFGTKAGDVFTRITIGVAAVWIILCMLLVVLANRRQAASAFADMNTSATESPAAGDKAGDDAPGPDKGAGEGDIAPPVLPAPAPASKGSSLPDAISDEPAAKTTAPADPAKAP